MTRHSIVAAGSACLVSLALLLGLNAAQPGGSPERLGGMFLANLKDADGCFGAELAKTESGKACIFAWFKDKAAVISWYNGPLHTMMMNPVLEKNPDLKPDPLAHVADDAGPIMVVATVTPSDENKIPGFPFAVSQASIELFAPLPGGVEVYGRLSPDGFKVPDMKDITPGE